MKAVFLDRDGTLIEEVNYLSDFKQLKIFPFSYNAIKILKKSGYKIIMITNQSGIGRGYFSEKFVNEVNNYLCNELKIDDYFYCPHTPEDNCTCRKPETGLIEKALQKYPGLDLLKSFFIGDKDIDMLTGYKAKVKTILVLTGYGKKFKDINEIDFIVKNIYYAALLIKSLSNGYIKG